MKVFILSLFFLKAGFFVVFSESWLAFLVSLTVPNSAILFSRTSFLAVLFYLEPAALSRAARIILSPGSTKVNSHLALSFKIFFSKLPFYIISVRPGSRLGPF
jgi:hypothetical protein